MQWDGAIRLLSLPHTTHCKLVSASGGWLNKQKCLSPCGSRQKAWDAPRVAASFKALQEATQDKSALARLLAASRKESGAWLHTLPVSSLGLRMEDDVFRVASGLRLGVPICQPHKCQLCGPPVDSQGTHGLHCRKSLGCHPRHSAINDLIKRSLGSAKI